MTTDRDDEDWFEAIAGRPRPDADPRTLLEATWLRAATRRWAAHDLPEDALRADAAEALLARARTEGMLHTRPGWCAGCHGRWRRWNDAWRQPGRPGLGFGAASLTLAALAVAIVLGVWRPAHEPAEGDGAAAVLRGAPGDGVWLLQAADPAAQRDALAQALAAAGVTVTRYERLGRFGLDADLGAAPGDAVRETLRRRGLQAAPDGSLRVEIEAVAP